MKIRDIREISIMRILIIEIIDQIMIIRNIIDLS